MKDLKCGLTDCEYNTAYACCAKQIEVTDCADCKTFKKDPQKAGKLFEMGEDFASSGNYEVDTQVYCKANCIFNKENKCCANGITVLDDLNTSAVCATFMKA